MHIVYISREWILIYIMSSSIKTFVFWENETNVL